MLSPRWRKLLRDVAQTPGRTALMVLAMAAGVCALATMLSSYTILRRETTRNYLDTNPPSATLLMDAIDAPLVAAIRAFPGVADAQASAVAGALLETGDGQWLPLTIFVLGDFNAQRINTIDRGQGAWPPPPGTLLLERDALPLAHAAIGSRLRLRRGQGAPLPVTISGTAHDPALPPASRGQTVYAFATPDTVRALGMDGTLTQLKLTVRGPAAMDVDAIEAVVAPLARWLRQQGRGVQAIRIPPPGEHPHQKVMSSMLLMLLAFSAIALLLSALLSATVLGGMLAQQRRQIGVMQAIGARSGQLAAMYLLLVALLAGVATALGIWGGLAAGRAFSGVVLREILNFTMHSGALPAWAYAALVAAGMAPPLLAAALPIRQASRSTVQDALSDVGSGKLYVAPRRALPWLDTGLLARLPGMDRGLLMALRNSVRRRGRLLLTVGLLGTAGAMYLSSLNVRAASQQHLADAAADRRYDIETVLGRPAAPAQVAAILGALPEVALAEPWRRRSAARERADGLEIERVYPDGAHGTLSVLAVPQPNATLKLAMLDGRWLAPGEQGTAVLNGEALEFFPQVQVGGTIGLSSGGKTLRLRVAGIARQYMSAATVFVTPATYASLSGAPLPAAQADQLPSAAYRIVLREHGAAALDAAAARISAALAAAGIEVRVNYTETMMRKEVDGHFDLLIGAMLFISLLMAAVGLFGLSAAMGSSVAERSREIGIMRSIGAGNGTILRNVLCEGVFIALLSIPLAFGLALPLSAALGSFLGNMLFGLGFPLVVSPAGLPAWLLLALAGALLASGLPAWRASRLSIHQSLSTL